MTFNAGSFVNAPDGGFNRLAGGFNSLRDTGVSAFSIATNWTNRVGWWETEDAVTSGGNIVSIPDKDGGTALTLVTGSAAIVYSAADSNFNDYASCRIGTGANDGLKAAIGDCTTDAATMVLVFKPYSKKNAVYCGWLMSNFINQGIEFIYANGFGYFARTETVSSSPAPVGVDAYWSDVDADTALYNTEPMVAVIRYSAAENKINIRVNGQRWGTDVTLTGTTTLNNVLTQFCVGGGINSYAADMDFVQAIVTDDYKSDEDVASLFNLLLAQYNIQTQDAIVAIGDSLTDVTGGWLADVKTFYSGLKRVYNESEAGSRLVHGTASLSLTTQDTDENRYARHCGTGTDTAIVFAGTNDISDAVAPATVLTRLKTLVTNLKAGGFDRVVVIGPLDRTGWVSETASLNLLMKTEASPPWDYYIDLRRYPEFTDNTDTAWFTDGVHLTGAGYDLLGTVVLNEFTNYIQSVTALPTPDFTSTNLLSWWDADRVDNNYYDFLVGQQTLGGMKDLSGNNYTMMQESKERQPVWTLTDGAYFDVEKLLNLWWLPDATPNDSVGDYDVASAGFIQNFDCVYGAFLVKFSSSYSGTATRTILQTAENTGTTSNRASFTANGTTSGRKGRFYGSVEDGTEVNKVGTTGAANDTWAVISIYANYALNTVDIRLNGAANGSFTSVWSSAGQTADNRPLRVLFGNRYGGGEPIIGYAKAGVIIGAEGVASIDTAQMSSIEAALAAKVA